MHPHVMAWWSRRQRHETACHPGGGGSCHSRGSDWHYASHSTDMGAFGVRRPLRFLTHKLELNDKQTAALARILDELKTERAQVTVDDRRTTSAFAATFEQNEFDAKRATEAAERRVESAKRLRDAVVKALAEIHALLDDRQRESFAYLIRTGVLGI